MTTKPASEAVEIALIESGRRGERARPSAAKRERSMRSAASHRKNEATTDRVGVAGSASNVTGCSSTSSNRITPSHARDLDFPQRQIFYVNLEQQVFRLRTRIA